MLQSGTLGSTTIRARPRWFRRNQDLLQPTVIVSVVLLTIAAICAIVPSLIAPYRANEVQGLPLSVPSQFHFLGTDQLGRDVFSRVVYGARNSLLVGVLAVAFGTVSGAILGVVSGYVGGRVDYTVQRVVDCLLTLPGFLMALVIAAALGSGIVNVSLAIALAILPIAVRIARASTLSVAAAAYVEAARTTGAGQTRIIVRHVVPNIMAPIIVIASIQVGFAIITEASLSYLGIGIPLGSTSWGSMLNGASQLYMRQAPWMAVAPGVAIALVVMAVNLIGDALRDVLDPRLRGRR